MIVSTWLYAEPEGEESTYFQMNGRSSSERYQAIYWKCVAAFFATSRRNNPDVRHLLFSNIPAAPIVDRVDLQAFLRRLEVEHVVLPYTFSPPVGYFSAWRNQFYTFDIIRYLSQNEQEDSYIVLDSDCVWLDSVSPLRTAVGRQGALTYTIDTPTDWPANGLRRLDMQRLFGEMLGRPLADPPIYCGGKLFAASGEALRRLADEIVPFWDTQLERHARGQSKCNEEAQALTYLYYKLGYALGTANPFIKRIWTGLPFRYRTDSHQDYGLVIWHLPMEKRWGFPRLFRAIADERSVFWKTPPGPPLARYLGKVFGVGRRPLTKTVLDAGEAIRRKLGIGR